MGLFGYSEKDYVKNSGVFKQRINKLLPELSRFGDQDIGLGGVLYNIMASLDGISYPKGKSKEQEAVDNRISKIISNLEQDLQKKNAASFSEHANLLWVAIDDCRRYGKEAFTADEIYAQEGMATCKGQIGDAINQKAAIEKQKAALLKKAKKLVEEGRKAEAQKLNIEYNACLQNEKIADKRITAFSAQYNGFLKVAGARANGQIGVELDANSIIRCSPAEFQKELREGNKKLEKAINTINEVGGIADEFEEEANQGFASLDTGASLTNIVENDLTNEFGSSVDNAKVDASEDVEMDDFMKMLNDMK